MNRRKDYDTTYYMERDSKRRNTRQFSGGYDRRKKKIYGKYRKLPEFVLLNREHGICISSSEGRKIKYKEGDLNGKCDE